MNLDAELQLLKDNEESPQWLQSEGYLTLKNGYLLPSETPKKLYRRVSNAAAERLNKPELANKFYDYISKGWLALATPVAANMGTERGLPISCYANEIQDDTDDIFDNYHEIAKLTKYGGGVGTYWNNVRGRGSPIGKAGEGGYSEGTIPFLKIQDDVLSAVAQSGTRRGSGANYLDVNHLDLNEFLDIRRQTGDITRRCLTSSFHHGVIIDDAFLQAAQDGDKEKRDIFNKVLKTRFETGEPYILFKDNMNRNLPQAYINNGFKVKTSNLCTEIFLHTDKDSTFVCVLSSINLSKYDEWEDTDLIQTAIWFLDGVVEEFIQKAKYIKGFEKAVNFAIKSRALGLGVLGWASLLQQKQIPFESLEAMQLNAKIFKKLQKESHEASRQLAKEYGEPEWCKNTGMRNSHTNAIAPTLSNSLICGGVSQGIEPIIANYYAQKTAKGTFIRKNPSLERYLEDTKRNTLDVWNQISEDSGSVKNVKCLTKEEKEVYLTAREINQFSIVRQAGQRQKWLDQGQSINLFFSMPNDFQNAEEKEKLAKYIFDVHMEAWQQNCFSLYYLRVGSALRGDQIYREASDCRACEA